MQRTFPYMKLKVSELINLDKIILQVILIQSQK